MGRAVAIVLGEKDIKQLEFTNSLNSNTQEFELGVIAERPSFEYKLHWEQVRNDEKPRTVQEQATCDSRQLFIRDLDGVRFQSSFLVSITVPGAKRDGVG